MTNALLRFRESTGQTQAQMAAALGVSPGTLCKWERGRVPAERVAHVVKVTGLMHQQVRPDLFMTDTPA